MPGYTMELNVKHPSTVMIAATMRFSIAAIAASVASVQAFQDTSPFIIFSSSTFPDQLSTLSQTAIQPAANVVGAATSFLKTCPSKIYYLLTPPSLSASDINAQSFPALQSHLSSPQIKSRSTLPSVRGLTSQIPQDLVATITNACGEEKTKIYDARSRSAVELEIERGNVVVVVLSSAAFGEVGQERREDLRNYDAQISTLIGAQPSSIPYTVIFSSTPLNKTLPKAQEVTGEVSYQSDFDNAVHMDLKRDLRARVPQKSIQTDQRPLFEAYQFLTPGLFMGILVTLLLVSILGVGLSAISSLKVSYGAFEKEMGPAAQRKLA